MYIYIYEVTFGRGDLSVCPLGELHGGPRNYSCSN